MTDQKYHIILRILHWTVAFIMLATLTIGLTKAYLPKDIVRPLMGWHITGGITVLFLAAVRIIARFTLPLPPMPADLKPLEAKAGVFVHYLFYVVMFALPITGYSMTVLRGYTPKWLGMEMPAINVATNRDLASIISDGHQILSYVFVALLMLHIAGALKHLLLEKVNLFKRIT